MIPHAWPLVDYFCEVLEELLDKAGRGRGLDRRGGPRLTIFGGSRARMRADSRDPLCSLVIEGVVLD